MALRLGEGSADEYQSMKRKESRKRLARRWGNVLARVVACFKDEKSPELAVIVMT